MVSLWWLRARGSFLTGRVRAYSNSNRRHFARLPGRLSLGCFVENFQASLCPLYPAYARCPVYLFSPARPRGPPPAVVYPSPVLVHWAALHLAECVSSRC